MTRTSVECISQKRRRAAAVVEFAVCLPLIMLLILGSIEATSAVFLKQALTAAAYEGIREAAQANSTTTLAQQRALDVLNNRQVRGFNVAFTPGDVRTAVRGQRIAIEVSAPMSPNSPFMGNVVRDRVARVRTVMIKE